VGVGGLGVDMSTPLLPEGVPETDANPVRFLLGKGRGG